MSFVYKFHKEFIFGNLPMKIIISLKFKSRNLYINSRANLLLIFSNKYV